MDDKDVTAQSVDPAGVHHCILGKHIHSDDSDHSLTESRHDFRLLLSDEIKTLKYLKCFKFTHFSPKMLKELTFHPTRTCAESSRTWSPLSAPYGGVSPPLQVGSTLRGGDIGGGATGTDRNASWTKELCPSFRTTESDGVWNREGMHEELQVEVNSV